VVAAVQRTGATGQQRSCQRAGQASSKLPFEPERNARAARVAIFPIAHDLCGDRAVRVEPVREAGRDLRRVVVVVGIESVPVPVGNDIPRYVLIEVEIGRDAQNVVWERGSRVLAPVLAYPGAGARQLEGVAGNVLTPSLLIARKCVRDQPQRGPCDKRLQRMCHYRRGWRRLVVMLLQLTLLTFRKRTGAS